MKRAVVTLVTVCLLAIAPQATAQGLEMLGTYADGDDRFDGAFLAFSVADDGVHDLAFRDTPLLSAIDVALDADDVSVDGATVTASGPNATVVLHDTPTGFVKVAAEAPTDVTVRLVDAADASAGDGTVTVERDVEAGIWVPGGQVGLDDGNATASLDAGGTLMFRVRPGGSFPAMSADHESDISRAVEAGLVGAEAYVQGAPRPGHDVATYAPMDVTVDAADAVTLTVDAEGHDGKVVVARVDDAALPGQGRVEVRFNGEALAAADGIRDVLDPDDDGVQPEVLHADVGRSHVVLTSVPHFSVQELSIQKVAELVRENPEIAAVTIAGAGAVVALAAAGIFAPRRP